MSIVEKLVGLRVVYTASIRSCRPCEASVNSGECEWQRNAQAAARVSVLLHLLHIGSAPLLWQDWSRRQHRRACMQLVRRQRIEVNLPLPATALPGKEDVILSRAQRAHFRLSWTERLTRTVRTQTDELVTSRLFGVPKAFAAFLQQMGRMDTVMTLPQVILIHFGKDPEHGITDGLRIARSLE